MLPTTFQDELWKCPYCDHWTNRIRQHLKSHAGNIPDWTAAENFCNEVSAMKRRRLEIKRSADPKRKETKAKAEVKRASDPKRQRTDPARKETLAKADAKRADDPKRKETLAKADAKRAD